MNQEIEIREATVEDLGALMALNAEVQNLHVEAMPERFRMAGNEDIRACFGEWLDQDDMRVVIALVKERVAGYTVLKVRCRPEHPFAYEQRSLEVDHICVADASRGQGVGKALIEDAKVMATRLGIDRLELTVWDFNKTAQDFFRIQGFLPTRHFMAMSV